MRRARLFYTSSHDIYSEVRCYVNWNSVYDVRFDAQFHYVCCRYKPFARVVHFVIPGVHPLPRQPHPAGCFNWLYQCCVIDAVYVQPWLVWTFFFQVCMRAMFWCPCTVLVFYSVLQLLLYCNKWYQSYRVGYKTCLTSYSMHGTLRTNQNCRLRSYWCQVHLALLLYVGDRSNEEVPPGYRRMYRNTSKYRPWFNNRKQYQGIINSLKLQYIYIFKTHTQQDLRAGSHNEHIPQGRHDQVRILCLGTAVCVHYGKWNGKFSERRTLQTSNSVL